MGGIPENLLLMNSRVIGGLGMLKTLSWCNVELDNIYRASLKSTLTAADTYRIYTIYVGLHFIQQDHETLAGSLVEAT
jgi:hypothetical protein